ncbi:MAG: TetR/AcrR family transcriptional regulator [Salinivirgaceae bacterium]|jgi:TetR/AcrR family transcriptional regulator|nr:TetR/AcrR family transcriptional regulator [Salinivirgaceae bacterium]
MANTELSTEDKIFKAANNILLLYGYHGTTMQKIAILAGVHKSEIHYYFRSKEKLYIRVVKSVIENFLDSCTDLIPNQVIIEQQRWFLFTELYNNQDLFEKSLKEIYLNDWNKKLNDIKKLLKTGETI